MPWITLDCGIFEHEKFARLPSDMARLGWVATLVAAKRQPKPGRFADETHLRLVIGRFGRFVEAYIDLRLLDRGDGAALLIHDWEDYQRDDRTAAERQRRWRERNALRNRDETVSTRAAARAVRVSVSSSVTNPTSENSTAEPARVGLNGGEAG